MRISVTELFPDDWKITVEVINGERDRRGNLSPDSVVKVPNCVLDFVDTVDPADKSQIPSDQPILYAPIGAPFKSTSKVRIPQTDISAGGLYVVDGEIGPSPLGLTIKLRKG